MFQEKNFDDINCPPPLPTFNWRSPLNVTTRASRFASRDVSEKLRLDSEVNPHEGYFHAIIVRFDQLEHKLESLIDKVVDEVKDGNEAKDLLYEPTKPFQPLIVRFERLEEKIKKLTDKQEYGKTTFDSAVVYGGLV